MSFKFILLISLIIINFSCCTKKSEQIFFLQYLLSSSEIDSSLKANYKTIIYDSMNIVHLNVVIYKIIYVECSSCNTNFSVIYDYDNNEYIYISGNRILDYRVPDNLETFNLYHYLGDPIKYNIQLGIVNRIINNSNSFKLSRNKTSVIDSLIQFHYGLLNLDTTFFMPVYTEKAVKEFYLTHLHEYNLKFDSATFRRQCEYFEYAISKKDVLMYRYINSLILFELEGGDNFIPFLLRKTMITPFPLDSLNKIKQWRF